MGRQKATTRAVEAADEAASIDTDRSEPDGAAGRDSAAQSAARDPIDGEAVDGEAVSGEAATPGSMPEEESPDAELPDGELPDGENGAAVAEPSVEELACELEAARERAEEHWEAVLRARAELENVRKRAERDVAGAHRYAVEGLVNALLPVKDSLELGIAAAAADDDVELDNVREGMDLTLKMMEAALEKAGVVELDPQGEGFDPDYHQAMTMQALEGHESGSVITVVQKGYMLSDRLVRPALVIVAK